MRWRRKPEPESHKPGPIYIVIPTGDRIDIEPVLRADGVWEIRVPAVGLDGVYQLVCEHDYGAPFEVVFPPQATVMTVECKDCD